MTLSALIITLLALSAILFTKNKCRTLKPFDRTTTEPLRGLLALLIVAHHLGQGTNVPFFSSLTRPIGAPIVAVFFLLSGYGLCISFMRKGKTYLNGFLGKRYSKILPAFILLTIIAMAIGLYNGSTLVNQAKSFIVSGDTPLPFSWFIYTIIYIYAAFYASALIGHTPKRTGVYFILLNSLYILIVWKICHWGTWWFVSVPTVNLGYYIALYEKEITSFIRRHPLLTYTVAISAVSVSFCASEKLPTLTSTPFAIWMSLWVLSLSGAVYLIIRAIGITRWKPLIWIAAFSMELYLVHGLPLTWLKPHIAPTNEVLYIIATYMAAIPMAWLVHKCVARGIPQILPASAKLSNKFEELGDRG